MLRTARIVSLAALASAFVATRAVADISPLVFERAIYDDGREGALKAPEGVACDDQGNVVVADTGNGRLVHYRYVAGTLSEGTEIRPAGITAPRRVQFDSKGNVLVLDEKARKVFRLDLKGNILGTVEVQPGSSPLQSLPVSFRADAGDTVHLLDVASRQVVAIDPSGKTVRRVDLPQGALAATDVHVDASGNVYVVDGAQATIWLLEKGASAFKTFTPSMKDKMSFPVFMTSGKGRFYVVDQNGNGIVQLGVDGAYLGRQLSIGWADGYLYYPSQLCVNGPGAAFVADRSNSRVQVFATTR